jgi:protein-tyrosine phosphatase
VTALPPRRRPGGAPYRIAIVCLGNICRSPMAEVVLTERLTAAGLADRVEVVSAGTGDWHVGGPMDRRAATLLTTHGYDASRHRAQQVDPAWLVGDEDAGPETPPDLVLAMDGDNLKDLEALGDIGPDRLRTFRDFDPLASDVDRDVPDPYYGGDDGFSRVLSMIERTAEALVTELAASPGPAGND